MYNTFTFTQHIAANALTFGRMMTNHGWRNRADLPSVIEDLTKEARNITRHSLTLCNGILRYDVKLGRKIESLTEKDQAEIDLAIDAASKRVRHLCGEFLPLDDLDEWTIEFNRDPRGAPIKLLFEGREIWAIHGGE